MTQRAQISTEDVQSAQSGDTDAMGRIIGAMGPVIESILRSHAPDATREDAADLRQEGAIAVMMAVTAWSTAGGASVVAYAYPRIQSAVRDAYLRSRPGSMTTDSRRERMIRSALARHDGDMDAAYADVAGQVSMKRSRFDAMVRATDDATHLDADDSEHPGETVGSMLAAPGHDTEAVRARETVASIFADPRVSARDEFCMRAEHGVGMPPEERAQVARLLGVGPVTHRKILSRAYATARMVHG
ncbi:sigma factor [Streptomyces sp. SM12]|uniref:sigma factor n=1 Tax=Streptomyces sp. SM12 TaxID=1071602 RepID=UPI0015E1ADB4|nr:sigma factor [Streptomyces sp. SM12]